MTTFSVEVRITPREGILDPEGQTIAGALANLGYDGVSDVRAGRLIRMRVEAPDAGDARKRVVRMCEELIANPVIEDYAVRLERAGEPADDGARDGDGDPDAAGRPAGDGRGRGAGAGAAGGAA